MGRETRMVPPNWEHPKSERYNDDARYQPKYDQGYKQACKEWHEGYAKWDAEKEGYEYWDYSGTPDEEYYLPDWKEGEATWIQLYETVSEGTPVSPPFKTKEELVDYLVENGDFWCQQDAKEGKDTFRTKPTRSQPEGMVDSGWACSMIVQNGVVHDAYQQQELKNK